MIRVLGWLFFPLVNDLYFKIPHLYWRHLVGVLTVERRKAETVNSGSVEPDQVKTCEGKQG